MVAWKGSGRVMPRGEATTTYGECPATASILLVREKNELNMLQLKKTCGAARWSPRASEREKK